MGGEAGSLFNALIPLCREQVSALHLDRRMIPGFRGGRADGPWSEDAINVVHA